MCLFKEFALVVLLVIGATSSSTVTSSAPAGNGSETLAARHKRQDSSAVSPEAYMTTPEIIRHRGYPVEVHYVTTADGYILELHRIPWSVKSRHKRKGKPVFLQHGMVAGDHVWLLTSTRNALAYVLADHGYDVWMGNSRGTTYSKKHVSLDPEDEEFWEFSWDEMGKFDIPASLNYILRVTQRPKLLYIGHSLGCGLFYIAMNEHPELNSLVETMVALAPASSLANLRTFRELALIFNPVQNILRASGIRSVLSSEGGPSRIQRLICQQGDLTASLCRNMLLNVFGYNPKSIKLGLMHVVNHHYPSGGSLRTLVHAHQNYRSGERFTRFDYGSEENMERYGTTEPPDYDLRLVTAPVYIIWAQNDPISPPEDVAWQAANLGNLKASFPVEDPLFNHMDFVWSETAAYLVNPRLLSILPPP